MSVLENAEIKKKSQEMLDKGVIRPITSPCGYPIVLVPKKDGTWHTCVEFRALNKSTVKNHYLLPCIYDLLGQLKDVVYFTKLDLRSGYHQIMIVEGDIWKVFSRQNKVCLNHVVRPFLHDFVIVYLDHILIFSKTHEEHVKHVKKVLDVLKKERLYLKMSKCEFGKTSLFYLGHIFSGGELKIDT